MGAGYIFELSLLWFYNGTRYRTYLTPTLLRLFPIHRTIKTSCELTASHVNAFSWRTRSAIRVGELSHTPDLLPGSQEMPSQNTHGSPWLVEQNPAAADIDRFPSPAAYMLLANNATLKP